MNQRFEWDQDKNLKNQRKHGLSFEEAIQVFHDPSLLVIQDRFENNEYRWQAFGLIRGILFIVAHTVQESGSIEIIRLISARRATSHERRRYEEENC